MRQFVGQSEFGQFADRSRLQIDADAQRPEVADRLVHPDRNARLVRAERQAEPADSATNDDHFHCNARYRPCSKAERGGCDAAAPKSIGERSYFAAARMSLTAL